MNFDIVRQLYPAANESDWHQHPNGGGWVANSASVFDSVSVPENTVIGDRAIIGDRASIGDYARIGYHARIGYRAIIGDRASIGNYARIGDSASIGDCASIGYRARIGDYASIGYRARIGDSASIGDCASIGYRARIGDRYSGDILYISTVVGHPITATREPHRMVQIGCQRMTIEEWIEKADEIGNDEKYSPDTIATYKILLAAVRAWMDAPLEEGGRTNE